MLETIVKNQVIFYVMGILFVLGVLTKVISVLSARRMVKAASKIHKSNHKLMKLVKAKFEHATMVSDKVQNVEAFVDKYVYEYKVCGISLNALRSFAKKALWLVIVLGVVAVFESYRIDGFGEMFLRYAQWSGFLILALALMCYATNESIQIEAAQNYMVEYLENVCAHRYQKASRVEAEEDAKEETIEESESLPAVEEPEPEIRIEAIAQTETTAQLEEERKKTEQEMRIRAILEEFLA